MGIKPVYVFDGKPPSLKTAEIARRKLGKKEATIKYEMAKASGDFESARKYAPVSYTHLTLPTKRIV